MKAAFLALSIASGALAQVSLPNEFETPGALFSPISSYFGGVAGFGARSSAVEIFAGGSMEAWANFRRDAIFSIAGFTLGTPVLSGASLNVPAGSQYLSITVNAPAAGRLSMVVAVREDDNGDLAIDTAGDDDQWETADILLEPGTMVYNIPLGALVDSDPDSGDNAQNFATTGAMQLRLTFETRRTYPGGIIETPTSLLVDHIGLFADPQILPPVGCPSDINGDGGTDGDDVIAYFAAWEMSDMDFNGDGGTDGDDTIAFFASWDAGC